MGKVFFLVWLTFNPNHTVTYTYLAGHEYASASKCMEEVHRIMEPEWMDWTKHDAGCTTNAPTHAGMVFTADIEATADDETFFIKAD